MGPLDHSPSREMKRLPFTSLSEETLLKTFCKKLLELRSTNSRSKTSPPKVSSVWTSTSSSPEQERESQRESTHQANSENSRELPLMKPSNGLPKRWLVPLFEHLIE